ncbi:MAG: hypothetical protein U9R36_06175, partial [Elusimicrobiota bacterium]|nr:hypothetical protein [Elusimicrobiota bacterium]
MKKRFKYFFNEKIWDINPGKYGLTGRSFLRALKIFVIIVRDFFRDRCHTLASSLTYFTLLGIVPFTAIIFVVLKHFGIQETYGADLLDRVIFDP